MITAGAIITSPSVLDDFNGSPPGDPDGGEPPPEGLCRYQRMTILSPSVLFNSLSSSLIAASTVLAPVQDASKPFHMMFQ
jgi:hypothetical protein